MRFDLLLSLDIATSCVCLLLIMRNVSSVSTVLLYEIMSKIDKIMIRVKKKEKKFAGYI